MKQCFSSLKVHSNRWDCGKMEISDSGGPGCGPSFYPSSKFRSEAETAGSVESSKPLKSAPPYTHIHSCPVLVGLVWRSGGIKQSGLSMKERIQACWDFTNFDSKSFSQVCIDHTDHQRVTILCRVRPEGNSVKLERGCET